MPEHLPLPDPEPVDGHRAPPGFNPDRPPPDRDRHGPALAAELASAVADPASAPPVVEGVDPSRVLKLRATGRLSVGTLRRRLPLLAEDAHWGYYVLADDDQLREFAEAVSGYAEGSLSGHGVPALITMLQTIEGIEPYGPSDRSGAGLAELSFDEPELVDILVWPSASVGEARGRLAQVTAAIRTIEGSAEIASDERPASTVLRARLSREAVELVLHVAVVEKVRPAPRPLIEPPELRAADARDLAVPPPGDALLGVIDDGVAAAHPLLAGLVVAHQGFPSTYGYGAPGPHGTNVAGLAAFGDFEEAFAGSLSLPVPARVIAARVLEPDPYLANRNRFADVALPHEAFEEALRWMVTEHGVRVVVAAIADPYGFQGPLVDEFTVTVDSLVRELDVVIVTACGNVYDGLTSDGAGGTANAVRDYPGYLTRDVARVAEPGTAALALTVGSVARTDAPATASGTTPLGYRAVAGPGMPSPFSRSGPGPGPASAGSQKPDLSHYGGNLVITDHGTLEWHNQGVGSITLHHQPAARHFAAVNGTSFAAPRVARVAAEVAATYPDASANLIRALVALSARRSAPEGALPDDLIWRTIGYGIPDIDRAVQSVGSRVVLMFDGEIDPDGTHIHAVPLPRDFVEASTSRTLRVAYAFDPPVRRQRREYIAGKMRVDLVHGLDPLTIAEIYGPQPSWQALRADPSLVRQSLPDASHRYQLTPGVNRTLGSTLAVQELRRTQLPDEAHYLVVAHLREAWARTAAFSYDRQRYAVVVELVDEERPGLDLYAAARTELTALRARLRGRAGR
ncbi:MAG TPA: S8 family serine peptidase [Mycobacteriales bacterium]|nr:S8 family serine peptidase [Mycobacteriales bacterium]